MISTKRRTARQVVAAIAALCAALLLPAPAAQASATSTVVSVPDAYVCSQPTSIGFEDFGEGTDLGATSFSGVAFTTTGGYTWRVADFATGYYNGKYPSGAYTSQGTHAAWLGPDQGVGRIDFANRASTVSVLVSGYTPVTLEAYNSAGTLLEATPYSRSNIRTGTMDLLSISRAAADIAYVVVHDSGNYFIIDSLCTDAGLTRPGTDLSITVADAVDPVSVGAVETFTLTVRNNGPLVAPVVDVSAPVAAGFTVDSTTPSQGSCPSIGNNVVCSLGSLAVGATATVTVSATATTAGSWTTSATAGGETADRVPANNVAQQGTTVVGTRTCTRNGTPNADTLTGTAGNDVICAGGGNDTILASGGVDIIVGGPGADTISYAGLAGPVDVDLRIDGGIKPGGTDELIEIENVTGTAQDDLIDGDDLRNVLDGGAGQDRVAGLAGDDLIRGGAGDDAMFAGPGENGIDGGAGLDSVNYVAALGPVVVDLRAGVASSIVTLSDVIVGIEDLNGSPFSDVLNGDDANNAIFGGGGNDLIAGRGGDDMVRGGIGADTLYGGPGTNVVDGGDSFDVARYDALTSGVNVNLVFGTATGAATDTLVGIEGLIGSTLADVLVGDTALNTIDGNGGNDDISGRGGNDQLIGGGGVDVVTFAGSPAPVTANLTTGVATGEGTDALSGFENVTGSPFADTLTGNALANVLRGGRGSDILTGVDGNDSLYGEADNDQLSGGNGNDLLDGGLGNDTLNGGANTDRCLQGGGTGARVACEL